MFCVPSKTTSVITIRMSNEHIHVLDRIVENGDFESRTEACRALLLPALKAGAVAMETGVGWKGMATYAMEIRALSKKMDVVAENSKSMREADGQTSLGLDIPNLKVLVEGNATA